MLSRYVCDIAGTLQLDNTIFLLIRSRNERPRHGSDVKRQGTGARGSGQRNRVLSEKGGKNIDLDIFRTGV